MENELIIIKNNEPITTSLIIAEGMNLEHRAVLKLIKTYKSDFEELGKGTFALEVKKSGGRPTEFYYLNEENATFVITLMRNSKLVVQFKKKLASAFVKCRRLINRIYAQQENAEWIEQRKNGKVTRKQETDIIREFIDYATAQGSTNAEMYYSNLTRMENQALFFIMEKYKNLREIMDVSQLIAVGAADQIVVKALRDGMKEQLPYKEIYAKAKDAVIAFSEIIGKSALPKHKLLPDGNKQIEFF